MRILYITRHFNHSGRVILERLVQEGFHIAAVLLHDDDDPWRGPWSGFWRRSWYRVKCWYYRCPPLRNTISEERIARRHGLPIIYTRSIKSDEFYARLRQLLHHERPARPGVARGDAHRRGGRARRRPVSART